MSENLKLKSISELLEESFFIPSYQRGYRWTNQQVEDLLEDILEFARKAHFDKKDGFYCLQPIVVKKRNDSNFKWDVIDGQQRLTTIYILLKYFFETTKTKPYKIGYETRSKSEDFLENKLDNIDESNIDFFHMSKAYHVIKEWFSDKDFSTVNLFLMYLLQKPEIDNKIDKASNIRVIWYEVEDNKQNDLRHDIEIFTRINMGKIPLTNAELVKALLLEKFEQDKQFEIASQWDSIEYILQHEDFWLFINKAKKEQPTRIEFIFELIAESYIKKETEEIQQFKKTLNKSIDTYYIFHIISHLLKNESSDESSASSDQSLWNKVIDYFRILNEWYEDREFIHKIGFLIIYSDKTVLDFIEFYTQENSTKDEFRDFLNLEIKKQFEDIEIGDLSYEKDTDKIRKVLLMFNIQTIINNEKSNIRFQFDRFKNEDWDIEHIRSQTDSYPTKKDEKIKWFNDIKEKTGLKEDDIMTMKDDEFIQFYKTMYEKFEGSDISFNKDRIGNLALLDATTNRGYGNAFFPIKRKIILENDMNGTFIPICTKNVFLKYYTKDVKHVDNWNEVDAIEYEEKIEETLTKYLKKEVEENE